MMSQTLKHHFFSKIKCVNGKGIFNCYLGFVDDIRQVLNVFFFQINAMHMTVSLNTKTYDCMNTWCKIIYKNKHINCCILIILKICIFIEFVGSSSESDLNILKGRIDVIYGSPEAFVGDPEWRNSMQHLDVTTIVIDEFHTIATW